ncbi:hypothetical protein ZA02_06955 [Campylobacter lanienae]|uniref:hypothetical protein n=1 Tax=Campylobacter lanienae TaxID=75658 RepID=UPI0011AD1AC1|nr:hypothetical protein [Campylobacter lanienae]TWO13732.1 hypothetical protein ZA02_06955 [Campylobacter lanienae]
MVSAIQALIGFIGFLFTSVVEFIAGFFGRKVVLLTILYPIIIGFVAYVFTYVFIEFLNLLSGLFNLVNIVNENMLDIMRSSDKNLQFFLSVMSASGVWKAFVDAYNIVSPLFYLLLVFLTIVLIFKAKNLVFNQIKYLYDLLIKTGVGKK